MVSPRFGHCTENRADRANTSDAHQDVREMLETLIVKTVANIPLTIVLNHVHSGHSSHSQFALYSCLTWMKPFRCFGARLSIPLGAEFGVWTSPSSFAVWVVSMLGSVRTLGASRLRRLLDAKGNTATNSDL